VAIASRQQHHGRRRQLGVVQRLANDAQSGSLSGSIVWTPTPEPLADRRRASFSVSNLIVGTHVITARCTDPGGLQRHLHGDAHGQSRATNTPPTVRHHQSRQQRTVTQGASVMFNGWQRHAGRPISSSLHWTERAGPDRHWRIVQHQFLALGTHTITAARPTRATSRARQHHRERSVRPTPAGGFDLRARQQLLVSAGLIGDVHRLRPSTRRAAPSAARSSGLKPPGSVADRHGRMISVSNLVVGTHTITPAAPIREA